MAVAVDMVVTLDAVRSAGPIVPSFSSKNLSAERHFRYLITDVASTEVFVDVHLTKERKKGG